MRITLALISWGKGKEIMRSLGECCCCYYFMVLYTYQSSYNKFLGPLGNYFLNWDKWLSDHLTGDMADVGTKWLARIPQ